jgi:1-acyl-sn-glycerol-3-phosphate acyltransferase
MNNPTVHPCIPQRDYGFVSVVAMKLLSFFGWKIRGDLPKQSKFILAVAPHTSNWDFFIGIAVMLCLQLKVKFLGKASIFTWPVKSFLEKLGGVPVNRDARHGVVEQIVKEFNNHEQFVLGLAPEGTRSKTREWKTGFLQIAYQAKIGVVPVSLDFEKKEVMFHPIVSVTKDIDLELSEFKAIFSQVCAKNPQAV